MIENEEIEATVTKIIPNGRHGPYAVTKYGDQSVTFSLEKPVWNEYPHPIPGNCVILSQIKKTNKGWRAEKASLPKLH
ncbi:MAG: hypothetical protein HGA67_03555 [Candidatus Yonathbacteria bacterium]|nr:hypothetical protein [Candidatus Yonathbacteria bacterium]